MEHGFWKCRNYIGNLILHYKHAMATAMKETMQMSTNNLFWVEIFAVLLWFMLVVDVPAEEVVGDKVELDDVGEVEVVVVVVGARPLVELVEVDVELEVEVDVALVVVELEVDTALVVELEDVVVVVVVVVATGVQRNTSILRA